MSWHISRCGHRVELDGPEYPAEPTDAGAHTRHSVADLAVPGPQHPATMAPAGVTDSQLAVLLRQTQWALDAAAYACGGGLTRQRREELAGTLEALAAIVRASAPNGTV